jgi:hypothetical protein
MSSSIEERLARDIAAVTGGVVVTESDLRDARDAVVERIDSQRQRNRRRSVIAVAAAAVLIFIVGVTAFLTLGGDRETAPPANPRPTTSDPEAEFLTGSAPTSDLLQGVWRLDNGAVQMRFSAPNVVSLDTGGRLFHNPGVHGTYVITGDLITVSVDGGPAGCGGQEFAMRASLPEPPVGPGALRLVHTQPGEGNCAPEQDERWVMEQVLPASPTLAGLVFSTDSGWQPLVVKSAMYGVWLAEGGGYVLEIDPGGSYYVADDSGEPVDRGQWSLRGGSDLTLTSSTDSARCSKGDRLVLGAVEQNDFGTRALRSTVGENTCGGAWAPAAWALIPHEGS